LKNQKKIQLKTVADAIESAEENEKLLISIQKNQLIGKKLPNSINNP
jgi:hypothetical protein